MPADRVGLYLLPFAAGNFLGPLLHRVLLRLRRGQLDYLTIGESFPLEVRVLAIALFFALGTGLGVAAERLPLEEVAAPLSRADG